MIGDEEAEGRPFKAVVLHDAEDVVHSAELRIIDLLIERFDLVQLPVLPLLDRNSRWIAGHYADEFAEAHGKELVVREALGASVPSAGVGCAFSRAALAGMNGGDGPFDSDSLTEDYELGLKLRAKGGRAAFVRLPASAGRPLVVTQEYFPSTLKAAVSQKARWMTGIALSGWDRLGWHGGLAECWMRLRDRQALLAALLLCSAYAALILWAVLQARFIVTGVTIEPVSPVLAIVLKLNAAMLLWRLGVRAAFVTAAYGWREGLRSIPRAVISNIIAMLAARRAVARTCRAGKPGRLAGTRPSTPFQASFPPNDRNAAAPFPGAGGRRMGLLSRRDACAGLVGGRSATCRHQWKSSTALSHCRARTVRASSAPGGDDLPRCFGKAGKRGGSPLAAGSCFCAGWRLAQAGFACLAGSASLFAEHACRFTGDAGAVRGSAGDPWQPLVRFGLGIFQARRSAATGSRGSSWRKPAWWPHFLPAQP